MEKSIAVHEHFLKNVFPLWLEKVTAEHTAVWGKMNAIQMVEHLSLSFLLGSGRISLPVSTAQEKIPVLKRILTSNKALPRLFQNPALPSEPLPAGYSNIEESKKALLESIDFFLEHYRQKPDATASHSILYGELNYEEWLIFQVKHIQHHLEQFGIQVTLE